MIPRQVPDAPILAGHPALDLLNTVYRVDGDLIDSLQSGEDVARWLERAGEACGIAGPAAGAEGLLAAARSLRETLRTLLERLKAGKRIDVGRFNTFLAASRKRLVLVTNGKYGVALEQKWTHETAEQRLAPIAEAAAELLTSVELSLVRCCEDESCVLWFYDQTKSHHRRWCSAATCGNRHKVNSYRARQKQAK